MLYQAFQAHTDFYWPLRTQVTSARALLERLAPPAHLGKPLVDAKRRLAAAYEVASQLKLTHARPPFGIATVLVGDREVPVKEEVALSAPFGELLHFRKDIDVAQPRVLVVAPMSGHFATLLKDTVRTMLRDHDVYITDWRNARDVSLLHGKFGLDEYITHLIAFLEAMGPGAHVLAVCQPCVAALAAAAVMAENHSRSTPRSLTLMAGPIDCRINPTRVNELATAHPIDWFEANLIAWVPLRFRGGMRRVYPGFLQLSAFMSMNLERHVQAFVNLHNYLLDGEFEKAEATRSFYEEYFAVADLPAEFYLETVKTVFQDCALAKGELRYNGQLVRPEALRRTALLTVEGERDDICALGQTLAAQDLCTSILPFLRRHHMQAGVGHYGVFSGKRWNQEVYPAVRETIYAVE